MRTLWFMLCLLLSLIQTRFIFFVRPRWRHFQVDETPTTVFLRYSNFADIFSSELVVELSKHIRINNLAIDFVDGKQLFYRPINSLEPMKLKTFKFYLETHLANGFIKFFESSIDALIFFIRKSDGSLCLCINYKGFNNLMIQN